MPGDEASYNKVCRAAELWRADGQPFSAGIAMWNASRAAWGNPENMNMALRLAQQDFSTVIESNPPQAVPTLAALYKLQQILRDRIDFGFLDPVVGTGDVRTLASELAQRLFAHFKTNSNADNYLVRGVQITTSLDGEWGTRFPAHEVPVGVETREGGVLLNIPSSFHYRVKQRDWTAAHDIIALCPHAFTSNGLRAWRSVAIGHVRPESARVEFDRAADEFEADFQPEGIEALAAAVARFVARAEIAGVSQRFP